MNCFVLIITINIYKIINTNNYSSISRCTKLLAKYFYGLELVTDTHGLGDHMLICIIDHVRVRPRLGHLHAQLALSIDRIEYG
jgi:hypothetical protein